MLMKSWTLFLCPWNWSTTWQLKPLPLILLAMTTQAPPTHFAGYDSWSPSHSSCRLWQLKPHPLILLAVPDDDEDSDLCVKWANKDSVYSTDRAWSQCLKSGRMPIRWLWSRLPQFLNLINSNSPFWSAKRIFHTQPTATDRIVVSTYLPHHNDA